MVEREIKTDRINIKQNCGGGERLIQIGATLSRIVVVGRDNDKDRPIL